jgi:hypothetical protein
MGAFMNDKANNIPRLALIISILSFILALVTAVNQYREKVEVIVERIDVVSIDGDVISLKADVIVANTSQSAISLIESSAYCNGMLETEAEPDLPLSLVQGYAERVSVYLAYTLSDKEFAKLQSGASGSDLFGSKWMSVRFKSAKGKIYSDSYRLDELRW